MTFLRLQARLALACLVVTCSAAQAGAARVAPLIPQIEPAGRTELRDRFHDALARGLQQGGEGDVISAAEVRSRLSGSEEMQRCTSGPCLLRASRDLKADRLALAEVAVSGRNYVMTLRLFDQGGAEMWRTVERCEICAVREADEALSRAAARMAPWVGRSGPTDQQRAESRPPPVPAPAPAPPAPSAPLSPPTAVAVTPPPTPSVQAQEVKGWTPYRYGWVAALAAGGLLVAGSIPFLAYASRDGMTTCGDDIPVRNCERIYQGNLGAGVGMLVAGLVVGGGGFGVLYALDRQAIKKRSAPRVSLLPLAGGAMAGLEGGF